MCQLDGLHQQHVVIGRPAANGSVLKRRGLELHVRIEGIGLATPITPIATPSFCLSATQVGVSGQAGFGCVAQIQTCVGLPSCSRGACPLGAGKGSGKVPARVGRAEALARPAPS